jgi:hypothetical protein
LCRPVAWRASLIAFSIASAPPSVKNTLSMSPGRISASFAPRRARISVAKAGWTYWSWVACAVIASITRRSPWPMLTDISWLLKSRICWPSGV